MTFWLYALVIACEQVAPHGDPLQPVPVVSKTSSDAAAPPEPENTETSEDEVFQISSEELLEAAGQVATEGAAVEDAVVEQDSLADDATTENKAAVESTGSTETAPEVGTPPSSVTPTPAAAGWGDVIGKKWPVRLVTTIPNATPPRAILGLPDGPAVALKPEAVVPDTGLVVVAIAPNSAELARIAPAGDHATIETMTLRAQY